MKRGRKTGTKIIECFCGQQFTSQEDYDQHAEFCLADRIVTCSTCGGEFRESETGQHYRSEQHKAGVHSRRERRQLLVSVSFRIN
jgi:hypothetical protein